MVMASARIKFFSLASANRTQAKAIDFAKKYGVKKVYDEIDEVFDDENVDIIYLATSHNTHYQFMKKALEHGKHLFVFYWQLQKVFYPSFVKLVPFH